MNVDCKVVNVHAVDLVDLLFSVGLTKARPLEAVLDFQAAFAGHVDFCCREGVKRSFGGVREDGVDNEAALGRGRGFLK